MPLKRDLVVKVSRMLYVPLPGVITLSVIHPVLGRPYNEYFNLPLPGSVAILYEPGPGI